MISSAELEKRILTLQTRLREKGLSGVIIADYINMFYYSGTAQQGLLLVGSEERPVLVIKSTSGRAREESPWKVYDWEGTRALPSFLGQAGFNNGNVGMELDIFPVNEYRRYAKILGRELVDASIIFKEQRMIKSTSEIELLKSAAAKQDKVLEEIPRLLRPGMAEVELAAAVEAFSRRQGHQGYIPFRGLNQYMFYGHITAGGRAAMPSSIDSPTGGKGITAVFPQSATLEPIEVDMPVLVDYVGRYDSYLVDQTRIYCMGKLPKKLTKAHAVALEIQEAVASAAKPGAVTGDLYRLAKDIAAREGIEENFMGHGRQVSFIGHGIGLELNELPVIVKGTGTILKEGMVFALEPKFVYPGQGVVGIENTYLITAHGAEKLSKYPDEIIYI